MTRAIIVLAVSAMLLGTGPAAAIAADSAPEAISGKVFLDGNGNGKLDPGEKGLAGIRLTDGVQFVTTDAEGVYRLKLAADYMIPYAPARTVSVCWPSGKWPTGKWWVRLSDAGDGNNVHFGLRDDVQKLPFAFVHISDDHGSGAMYTKDYAPDVREMGDAVKFCFNTGDMGYATLGGAEQMFTSLLGHASKFPVPMFISPGNHDFVGEEKDARMTNHPLVGHGAQTKYLGPIRWSFDYAGVHFSSIDYMEKTAKRYEDRIPHIGVQWLEKDLDGVAKDTRVILLVHCYDAWPDFFKALHKYKVNYICCGHTHTPIYARLAGVPCHTNFGLARGVVTKDAIDVAEGNPRSFKKNVLLGYFRDVTCAAMVKRRQKQHAAADKRLENATFALSDAAAESAEIIARIEPGTAKKLGLRFGQKDPIEITFDGQSVNVAGAPFPYRLAPGEKALDWHILMDRDRLTIACNDLFRVSKAVKVDRPAAVMLVAEGGAATFQKAEVWELRPVTDGRSRGLHHFAPPAWTWGVTHHVEACAGEDTSRARDVLKRYSPDGVMDYDAE